MSKPDAEYIEEGINICQKVIKDLDWPDPEDAAEVVHAAKSLMQEPTKLIYLAKFIESNKELDLLCRIFSIIFLHDIDGDDYRWVIYNDEPKLIKDGHEILTRINGEYETVNIQGALDAMLEGFIAVPISELSDFNGKFPELLVV